jgi:hypothetical protein
LFSKHFFSSFVQATIKRKRSYGKNKSLSRKKKRGTAKTVQPGAHKAAFVRQRQDPTRSVIPVPKSTSQQKIKALTNALQYQRKKSSAAIDSNDTLTQQVRVLKEEVTMKDHEAGLRNMEIAHLEASVERTKQTLECRTARFIAYNEKKDKYIQRIKKECAHRLAILRCHHDIDIAAEQSKRYRSERAMSKNIVSLQSQLHDVEKSARYVSK